MFLVTGGAGFIGSNLAAALEPRGEVVVCDRLRSGDKWRNLAGLGLSDLITPEALDGFLAADGGKLKGVFHMGAISATTETDADKVIDNNFRLSQRLWSWCATHDVSMFWASSAATYGGGEHGFDDRIDQEYLAGLRPLNPYGWSKLLFDRWALRRAAAGNAPPRWAGLKFFNVYGPHEGHKGGQQSVVGHLWPRARDNQPAVLFRSHRDGIADGGQMRDFVWVGDIVDVMLWLLDGHKRPPNALYNVGSGKARSFRDLATAVYHAAGRYPSIEFVDTPAPIRDKYQYFTQADLSRLRQAGYDRPMTTLEDGVTKYVAWLRDQDTSA